MMDILTYDNVMGVVAAIWALVLCWAIFRKGWFLRP